MWVCIGGAVLNLLQEVKRPGLVQADLRLRCDREHACLDHAHRVIHNSEHACLDQWKQGRTYPFLPLFLVRFAIFGRFWPVK